MSIYIPKAIVYIIIHIPTGRYYIGKTIQVQEFINEEYNGSGIAWDNIYNAHPPEEFQREILKEFDAPTIEESEKLALEYEGEIVTVNLINSDPLCMNRAKGGKGGNSELQKQYYKENPELKEIASIRHKQFWINNPNARKNARERSIKQFSNPDNRKKASKIQKKRHEDNPNAGKEHGIKMKQYYEDNPKARINVSKRNKQYYIDNPEKLPLGAKNSQYKNNISTQSIVDLMSQKTKEKGSYFTEYKWRIIAKENNSLQCFTSRIPEINNILKIDCKTMNDVFKWVFHNSI